MTRDFYISLAAHLVILLAVAILVPVTAYYQMKGYPQIYRVGLVSLPAGGGVTTGQASSTGASAPAEGVGLKEIKTEQKKAKKTQPKALQQKTQPSKKTAETIAKPGEGKGAGGKEGKGEGYEVSLGGGLGSAYVEGGNFESSYYLDIAFGKIRGNFSNPLRQTTFPIRTTVYFKILKDGKIAEPVVEAPSGVAPFDQAALRAVISSDPLPPLPQEYKGEWLGIHLEFEFLP
ncbi:MAG: cell envelope integrity protein TolA [candidate division Zixibacteria bacterium]|nr:cell envelope integrity protein TolA [candidate division Zixibacteria bacterium]